MNIKRKKYHQDIFLHISGYLLLCSFITAVVTGILIAGYYIPTPEKAALSLQYLNEQVFAGAVIIAMHRLSGMLALFFTLCNILLMLPAKEISGNRIKIWRSGMVICVLFFGLHLTGYLLTGTNSAGYLLRTIPTKIFKTGAGSQGFPQLFDTLSIAFIRVYVLHGIILPAVMALFVYTHIQAVKQLHAELKSFPLPPLTVYALFCSVVVAIALLIKPVTITVSTYGDTVFENVPWSIKFILSVKQVVPLSIAVPAFVIIFVVFWFMGTLLKRFKP
jgi:hypothetical protein